MIGQNGFSNTNNNPNAVYGGASTGTPTQSFEPTSTSGQSKPANKSGLKTAIIAVIAALVGAGVAVAIVLLVTNKPKEDQDVVMPIQYASPDNDGTQTIKDTLEQFDKEIVAASTDDEKFSLKLNKIGYYIITEDYSSAISSLNEIDVKSLDDFDQYRVYNYYATAYEAQGNADQAAHYKALAEEAQARDFSNA